MSTGINPILNLLTAENQYAYKQKKLTMDILALVNQVLKRNETHNLILFDFPKDFGNIERDIMWPKLYESGRPCNFVRTIRIGHECNRLIPKCGGYIGKSASKGVFQGSPMGATLFIIYAENGETIPQ